MGKIVNIKKQEAQEEPDSITSKKEVDKKVKTSLREVYFESLKQIDDLLNDKLS